MQATGKGRRRSQCCRSLKIDRIRSTGCVAAVPPRIASEEHDDRSQHRTSQTSGRRTAGHRQQAAAQPAPAPVPLELRSPRTATKDRQQPLSRCWFQRERDGSPSASIRATSSEMEGAVGVGANETTPVPSGPQKLRIADRGDTAASSVPSSGEEGGVPSGRRNGETAATIGSLRRSSCRARRYCRQHR